jgi:bis(5'-nucleosyl)-tetraphosphatase (symmetrical)
VVHAGVVPQWSAADTWRWPRRCSQLLAGADLPDFLQVMYGNEPARWKRKLSGPDRWRFVINVLTRIRFCRPTAPWTSSSRKARTPLPPT